MMGGYLDMGQVSGSRRTRLRDWRIASLLLVLLASFGVAGHANALTATSTAVSSSANPSGLVTNVTFTAIVTSAGGIPTGPVTFNFGDGVSSGGVLDANGRATASHVYSAAGTYAVTATYAGDANYATSLGSTQQTISKATPTVALTTLSNPDFANHVGLTTFRATVTGVFGVTPTGTVTFDYGDGASQTVNFVSPSTLIGHTYAVAGSYVVTVTYNGDSNYTSNSANAPQTITKQTTVTTLNAPGPAVVGLSATFTAQVVPVFGGTPTGTVSFDFGDGTTGSASIAGGTATINHTYLTANNFTATATYGSDATFAGSSGTKAMTVIKSVTTTTVVINPSPASVGQLATVTATIAPNPAVSTPVAGTVTFAFGDGTTAVVNVGANNTATATHAFVTGGNLVVGGIFAGDSNFQGSTGTTLLHVTPGASTTALTVTPNPGSVGQSIGFTATVSAAAGTPTGPVLFDFGDGTNVVGTLTAGSPSTVTVHHPYPAKGAFTVTANYAGDVNFNASNSAPVQEVIGGTTTTVTSAPNPSLVGQSVAVTATVVAPAGTPTGNVTFAFGDGTTAPGTLTGAGTATVNHTYAAAGSFTITATYNGDVNDNGSSGTTQQGVNLNNTSTTLISSRNPSEVGQAVTFTASVTSGGGTPSGTMTFKDGGAVLGAVPLAGGVATFTTASLTQGSHSITANYAGSSVYANSTLPTLIQVVNIPADSLKLRAMQVLAAPVAAQASGQAISGAVENAITEGFSGGGAFVTPSAGGIRFNFGADPDGQPVTASAAAATGPFARIDAGARPGAQSPARVDDAFAALSYAGATKAPPRAVEPRDWLGWAEVRGAVLDHWNGNAALGLPSTLAMLYGSQVNVLAGLTRRLTPNVLVGALGGYETFDYRSDALQGRLKGEGWTIGSYLGWRITPNVRFDASAAYSGIGYDGTAGLAAGSFGGQRFLLSSGLTGTYDRMGFRIEPSARIYALWEHENGYVDTLGTLQAARDFSTGRASGGVKLIYPVAWSPTVEIAPYAGLYGDYYFNTDTAAVPLAASAVPSVYVMEGWSARAIAGVAAKFGNGAQVSLGGERSGIGSDFALWTYRARASIPFGAQ